MAKIKIDFAKQVNNVLVEYKNDVQKLLDKEVIKTAELIIDDIKILGPRSNNISSNHLRDSFIIEYEKDIKGLTAIIFSDVKGFLTHFLEYGNIDVRPHPFLRPIYDKHIPLMLKRIESILERGIKK